MLRQMFSDWPRWQQVPPKHSLGLALMGRASETSGVMALINHPVFTSRVNTSPLDCSGRSCRAAAGPDGSYFRWCLWSRHLSLVLQEEPCISDRTDRAGQEVRRWNSRESPADIPNGTTCAGHGRRRRLKQTKYNKVGRWKMSRNVDSMSLPSSCTILTSF